MAQLAKLSHQAEQLTEQFNKASGDVLAKEKTAASAVTAANRANQRYQAASGQLRISLVEQYKGAPISVAGALFSSGSTQQYLDKLAVMSILTHQRAGMSAAMNAAFRTTQTARGAAAGDLAAAKAMRAKLVAQRASVAKQQRKFNALLNTLSAAQRNTYFSGGQKTVIHYGPVHAPSPKAQIAVNFALAQLGKPYVWGAAGPSSYDCSGLVMAAWAKAGVQLSHYAPTQFTAGHHIPQSDLAPGDLVFFYPGIQHVAMYIGKGNVVHAPQTGDVVRIVPLATMQADYQGAVRLP